MFIACPSAHRIFTTYYVMETKQEIVQLVESLPDEVLGEVLAYLRQFKETSAAPMQLLPGLATILAEDREVLAKLAK